MLKVQLFFIQHSKYYRNVITLACSRGIHPLLAIVSNQSYNVYIHNYDLHLQTTILWNPSSQRKGLGKPKREGVGVNIIFYWWHIELASSHSIVPNDVANPPNKFTNELVEQDK